MQFFEDKSVKGNGPNGGQVFAYDPDSQQSLIDEAMAKGWKDVSMKWPPAPSEIPLGAQAIAALPETDMVALRCWKSGVSFPSDWVTYTTDLRNIANGTDTKSTSLPTKPAYPSGT